MATLHLMCGLPCSGKTTLAKQLEHQHAALRLTTDEWHICLFGKDWLADPDHDTRHNKIEAIMWEVAARALTLDTNVILDFGLWAKEERDDFRARAAALGASSELHFLNVSEEELLRRLAVRNAQLPDKTFIIPEEKLKEWLRIFQAPAKEELRSREFQSF
jgi:predicted kinase